MTEPEKRPTARELTERIAEGVASLVKDAETKNAAKTTTDAPKPYTEADALARCISALQALKDTESRASRNSYVDTYAVMSSEYRSSWGPGDRILRFLADRFGVSLIEVQRPDCSRQHLDQISPDQILNALNVAGGPR